jgi:hypothetical protein
LLFEKGFCLETVERNLDGAIQIYEAVLARKPQDQHLAARTYYRLAECFRKKGEKDRAAEIHGKLLKMFPDEKELVEKIQQYRLEQRSRNTPEEITKLLEATVSVEFSETPVQEFFGFLRNRSDMNIVLTAGYQANTRPIDIAVDNLKAIALLRIVMEMTQGDFVILPGALLVGGKEEIAEFKHREWPDVQSMPAWAQAMEQKLKETECSMEFVDSPLTDVIRKWSKINSMNMVLHPLAVNRKISIQLMNISSLNALRLLCLYHGDLVYVYKENVLFLMPWSLYKKGLEEADKLMVPIIFRIKYDVPPPQGYPGCKALFMSDGHVIVMDASDASRFRIAAGSYKLNFELPGYFYGRPKSIQIEKSTETYLVEEKLLAIARAIVFDVEDTSTGQFVPAEKLFVNGKSVGDQDTFKPGTALDVTIEFKDYETFQGKITLEPGKGPFGIKASLQKKKSN